MKKFLRVIIPILTVILIAALVFVFRDPILDLLNVDQSGWKTEGNITCYLNAKGDPITGWQTIDGRRYYFNPATGAMQTGRLVLSDGTYYLKKDGTPASGWQTVSGATCYVDSNGKVVTGWAQVGGTTYCFDSNGIPLNGWQEIDGSVYYFLEDGSMYIGLLETEAEKYFLDGEGKRYSGWLTTTEGVFYFDENGQSVTGRVEVDGRTYYLDENGVMSIGWQEDGGKRYYLLEDGSCATGWQDIDGKRYYFKEDGTSVTGWLEQDGSTYYLQEDGSAAVGKLVIDEETYYFASNGANILLVNRWNTLPDDYEPEGLVESECGAEMLPDAAAALDKMIEDCKAAGYKPMVRTSYRTFGYQKALLDKKVAEVGSYDKAIQIVAIPGTSEHHTGLAVDVSDSTYTYLNREQGNQPVQQWLREHCWEYGFIVRYPDGTTDITGIIYESWHFRYVGVELAKEITESGLCLEAYLDQLTNDGTTCGDPASLKNE